MRDPRPIVFLGTPEAASTVLERLIEARFDVVHVVTRPDARRGRGGATSASPVKSTATSHGIDVSHDLEWLEEHADSGVLGIVVAYGRIIPSRVLGRMQMLNVHFSLLPRWRGAAPVERAILAGDRVTGVCLMGVEPTLDTGPVYARAEVAISDLATTASLTAELAVAGAQLLAEVLDSGLPEPEVQSGEVTYADKISVSENLIDWTRSAIDIDRQVRALRAHTSLRGSRLRVIACSVLDQDPHVPLRPGQVGAGARVGTSDGLVQLTVVQPEGKAAMDAGAWFRGLRDVDGIRFD